jgi:hypothetical protein
MYLKKKFLLIGIVAMLGSNVFASDLTKVTSSSANHTVMIDESAIRITVNSPTIANFKVIPAGDISENQDIPEIKLITQQNEVLDQETIKARATVYLEFTVSGAANVAEAKKELAAMVGGSSTGSYIYVYVNDVKTKAYYSSYRYSGSDIILTYSI